MELDGWTLLLQAINFLILIWILQRFLYRPLCGLIEQRQAATQQAFAEAEKRERDADVARADYEAKRQQLLQEREKLLEDAGAEIARERDETRRATREKADAELARAHTQIEQERAAAADAMFEDAVALAGDLAKKLLAGVASVTVTASLLQSVLDRLAAQPPDRLEALRTELGDDKLIVAAAPGLEPDQQAHCRERLAAVLGGGAEVEFVTDDSLIVGAELRFPHAVIGYTWRDGLANALTELRADDGSE